MLLCPDYNSFEKEYKKKAVQLVWARLVADLETPVSVYLKVVGDQPNAFLLESVEGGVNRGRYSIIGMEPDIIWRTRGMQAEINRQALLKPEKFEKCELNPLDSLRQLLEESRLNIPSDLPPMSAGIFGFMGYDTIRLVEKLPTPNPDRMQLDDAYLIRPTIMLVFDSVRDEMTIITPVRFQKREDAKDAYLQAEGRIEKIFQKLEQTSTPWQKNSHKLNDIATNIKPRSNTTAAEYKNMVRKAQEYIAAGDIFQVVLSQRFQAPFKLPPFALYRALRRTNPSPYLYYLAFPDFSLVGSSPEILVKVQDGEVSIRPIAGTRPRGKTPEQDKELAADLLADKKECAEHLMLLDLGRNDVGRVAKPGTVEVTDSFFLEFYSQVMHIVSHVTGKLNHDQYDAINALMAGFPAGTVSGAPKIRAMEIIDELEKAKRGIYAGCVGYFSADGNMDSCIVLRTAIVKDGKMYVQAGAGIVADSVPDSEQKECINKAKALFCAAQEAVRFDISSYQKHNK